MHIMIIIIISKKIIVPLARERVLERVRKEPFSIQPGHILGGAPSRYLSYRCRYLILNFNTLYISLHTNKHPPLNKTRPETSPHHYSPHHPRPTPGPINPNTSPSYSYSYSLTDHILFPFPFPFLARYISRSLHTTPSFFHHQSINELTVRCIHR